MFARAGLRAMVVRTVRPMEGKMFSNKLFLVVVLVFAVGCAAHEQQDDLRTLSGTVLHEGASIKDAEVVVLFEGEKQDYTTVHTDEQGRFAIDLMPQEKVVEVAGGAMIGEQKFTFSAQQPDVSVHQQFELTPIKAEPEGEAANWLAYKGYGCSCHNDAKVLHRICCGNYNVKGPWNWTMACSVPFPFLCAWKK